MGTLRIKTQRHADDRTSHPERATFALQRAQQLEHSDPEEAMLWYRTAADAGNTDAMVWIADRLTAPDIESDPGRDAIDWYIQAAEHGEAYAMRRLGELYWFDPSRSAVWFSRAVAAGLADYEEDAEAARATWSLERPDQLAEWEAAALQGEPGALLRSSFLMLREGNHEDALELFERVAPLCEKMAGIDDISAVELWNGARVVNTLHRLAVREPLAADLARGPNLDTRSDAPELSRLLALALAVHRGAENPRLLGSADRSELAMNVREWAASSVGWFAEWSTTVLDLVEIPRSALPPN
jgi:hypothetical protein